MKLLLPLTTLILFTNILIAQPSVFQLALDYSNNDRIADLIENSDGELIVVSTTYIGANFDISLVRLTLDGTILNSKSIGTSDSEFATSVCQTDDGGYFITGYTFSSLSDNDALAIKVDSLFNVEFFKRLGNTPGNDYANNGFEASPGVYTFTGTIALGGSAKPAMVSLDITGSVISEKYLNTNQFASPDYYGSYLGDGIVGFAHLSNAITLVDTSGALIKDFPFSHGGYTSRVIKSNDDHFISIGVSGIGAPLGSTIALCKGDSANGSFTFSNKFQLNGFNLKPTGILQDADDNYYISANMEDYFSGYNDAVVIKTDGSGNLIWAKQYTPAGSINCEFGSIMSTSDGRLLMTGVTQSGVNFNSDVFLTKIDTSGFVGCNVLPVNLSQTGLNLNSATLHTPFSGSLTQIMPGSVVETSVTGVPDVICFITGIHSSPYHNGSFIVFPSNFSEMLTIQEKTNTYRFYYLEITDLTGRVVYNNRFTGEASINLSDLNAALYSLSVYSDKKELIYTTRVNKM